MDTEGQWSAYRIPGYTGFVPGKKDIYGKSYGRMPAFKEVKEKRNETKETTPDEYKTKNTWQVMLPPVRIIPGYTGHLPGKSYVFGKTFTQQVDECFNILATSKKVAEEKRRNILDTTEMNNSKNLDKRRPVNRTVRSNHPPINRITRTILTNQRSNITPLTVQSAPEIQPHSLQKNEDLTNGQIASSRLSNSFSRESTRSRTEVLNASEINLRDYRTFADKERKQKETSINGNHEPHSLERNYEYFSKQDVSPEFINEITSSSKIYPKDKQYKNEFESKINVNSTNSVRNNGYVQTRNEYNNYPSEDSYYNGVEKKKCSCCQSHKSAVGKSNGDDSYEERRERKYDKNGSHESKLSTSQNYYNNKISNKSSYNLERSFAERKQLRDETNHHRMNNRLKHNVDFSISEKENESNRPVNKENFHLSTFDNSEKNWINTEHETIPRTSLSERNTQEQLQVTKTSDDLNQYHQSTERNRESFENSNLQYSNDSWQGNRNQLINRKEDNTNGSSTRYFNTSLYPPIAGYRGYIPRLNSSSALGIPFSTHIRRNVNN